LVAQASPAQIPAALAGQPDSGADPGLSYWESGLEAEAQALLASGRSDDIPILARHFLVQSARQLGVEPKRLSEGAMRFLAGLELPGNVRQLENLCNWITVMAPGQTVEVKDLPRDLTQGQPLPSTLQDPALAGGQLGAPAASTAPGAASMPAPAAPMSPEGWIALLELQAAGMLSAGQMDVMDTLGRQFESALIKTALKHTHGRKNDAAMRLGIGRNTITRKIGELGIDGARDE
jgi:two-component system nitrogen regulation response regulator GlnG